MKKRSINIYKEDKVSEIKRIIRNEKYIMLPIKVIVCLMAFLFLYFYEKEHGVEIIYRYQLGLYAVSNLMFVYLLLQVGQVKLNMAIVRIAAYFLSLIDNLFLCYVVYSTGGIDSRMYWFYCAIMIRNAANFPAFWEQMVLNLTFVSFYIGVIFLSMGHFEFINSELFLTRIIMLVLVSFCGWGVINLLRKMKQEQMEYEEIALREEKFFSQEKLATEVAHELKNPLGIINNAVFVLTKKLRDMKSDPLILRQLEIVKMEIGRSDKIITDLLGYARMRDGKINEVDVAEILDNALAMVLELHPDYGDDIDIKKIYAKNMPGLWIDPGQLQQVFINLLTNAVESFDSEYRFIQLETQYDQQRREIIISFQDRGRGIEKDCQLKIFDSFFTTKKNGTGLGLSIAKNIVETYNGFISVESEKGMGTMFYIRFPVMISRVIQKMRAYHEI